MRRVLLVPLTLTAAWLTPRAASACATCSCGDPTLTSMGTEQSYAGRLRLSLGYSHRSDQQGEEAHAEHRLDLNAAYSPTAWLQLAASLPLLERRFTDGDLAPDRLRGSGDADVRARVTVWKDRGFAPRHLLGVTAGATLPTAAVQRDEMDDPLDLDHQLGGLALVPRVGATYTYLAAPLSAYASASYAHPLSVAGEEHAGDNLNATATLQWQPGEHLGLRLGMDGKWEGHAVEAGMDMRDTGGWALFATPGLVYSPVVDLVLQAQVQIPVVNGLNGDQSESPVVLLATSYDF